MKTLLIILTCYCVLVTCKADEDIVYHSDDAEHTDLDWNWDAGVPHYPYPRYNENGEVLFFPRIIGGEPAFHGEFQAKISIQTRRGDHFCGGALIDLRHVLTAAHCLTTEIGRVIRPDDIRLMGDDLSIEARNAARSRQIRYATHLFVHPEWNTITFAADIAVVRVSVPFLRTPTLGPMPRAQVPPSDGLVCQLAGWGVTSEIRVRPHPILLRVELDIISIQFCNGTQSFNGAIPPNFFCAGSMDGARDACFGDSGGGLMCNNQISGVVSFGFGCGRRNFPGAYVEVAFFNRWINECLVSTLPNDEIPRPSERPSSTITHHLSTVLFVIMIAVVNLLFLIDINNLM